MSQYFLGVYVKLATGNFTKCKGIFKYLYFGCNFLSYSERLFELHVAVYK